MSRARPGGRRGQRRGTNSAQAGFTLVEVLIALSILAFMMTLAWSTTSNSVDAKIHFETIEERNHEIRIAQARMVQDLSSAYISGNEDQTRQERRTLFSGGGTAQDELLRFSTFVHKSLWAEANESEQTQITYFMDSDIEERNQTNLFRREARRVSNEPWKSEPGEIDVLLRDVEEVEFEFWSWQDNEWKQRWDTRNDEKGKLPTRVRITIELETGDGGTVKYMTQARIMMQEELRFFTN